MVSENISPSEAVKDADQDILDKVNNMEISHKEFPVELPAVVVRRMLEVAKDNKFTRLCRLVCRSWNEIACHYLRQNDVVKLHERQSWDVRRYAALFLERKLQFGADFPTPFQDYSISVTKFSDPEFTVIAKGGNVVSVKVDPNPGLQIEDFTKFLMDNRDCIKSLNMVPDHRLNYPPIMGPFTNLTTFSFSETCISNAIPAYVGYVRGILHHPNLRLQSVELRTSSPGALGHIMSDHTNAGTYVTFHCAGNVAEDDVDAMSGVNFSTALQDLTIERMSRTTDAFTRKVVRLVERLKDHLRTLKSHIKAKDINFVLSQLTTMTTERIDDASQLGHYNSKYFPKLEQVMFTFSIGDNPVFRKADFPVHPGVTSLNICQLDDDSTFETEHIGNFFMCMRQQFPNVRNLKVVFRKITTEFFLALKTFCPEVAVLHMQGICYLETFSGCGSAAELNQLGWSHDEIFRKASILDLKELQTLWVGHGVKFTQAMMMNAMPLARLLPKLQLIYGVPVA